MKPYFSIFALFLFFSCSTSKTPLNGNAISDISGTSWKGTIPCADCEGIAVQLTFNPDKRFRQTYVYLGKNVSPFVDSGNWAVEKNDMIRLTGNNGHKSYLRMAGNRLQMLDANKKTIDSPLKEMYFLSRMEGEENPAIYNEKMLSGTDFTASGNEPFWGLDIDFETNISFANADGFELNVPFVKTAEPPGQTQGPIPAITYFSATKNGSIAVEVDFGKCTNSMSGAVCNTRVKVEVTDAGGNRKRYEGCGRFLGNARLNNLWKLRSIGDQPNDTLVIKQAPTIQFRIESGLVAGFSGCNRFHGSMELVNDSISFKQMASTLMACPEQLMRLEDRYLKLISGQKDHFIVTDNLLFLGEGSSRMIFETAE